MAAAAAEWELLHNRYYRKPLLYAMAWTAAGGLDLRRHRAACAPFGGPIAAIRDDSKIVLLRAESARPRLRLFSSAGLPIASLPWDKPGGRLVGMAWTDQLVICCLVQDGTLYMFDVMGQPSGEPLSLGKACFEEGVADCVFFGSGLVCRTERNSLFCVPDLADPKPCRLADPGLAAPPTCMAVIDPRFTMSGNVEVLIGMADEDGVMIVDEDGAQRVGAGVGKVTKMAVSGNGKMLGAFTEDGRLLVISTDFSRIMFEYDCQTTTPPEQMAWCGMDSVLLYWDELLLMVGPHGDPVNYPYEEPLILIPECDGVRILSNSSMEFLQRVPDSTESIFQIGSTEPAALLYDALEHFDRRSAKADENLRLIRSSLPEAVEACIDAAGHEFDLSRQRLLLRAASYGQAFCSQFQRDRLQEMCKILRVLNAVRDPEIGIPLSIQQFKFLTPSVLIGRLINAHRHLLALRISEHLNMNSDVVIMHWACAKITSSSAVNDADLLDTLLDKLKLSKVISYAAVAAHADSIGRRKLAAMLVDHEPISSKQIPLLLSIGEDETAFAKASESGDTDLIYLVLFHVWQKKSPLVLFGMVQAKPLVRDLFINYARCRKHEFLKDFYLSISQLHDVAYLLLKESWEMGNNLSASRGSGSPLQGPRIRVIEQAQKLFAETKEHVFESKAAEEYAKLLKVQHELEVSTKQAIFVDSSISDTICTCIVLGNHRAAMRVKQDFKLG
ncbi:vacuoleless1 (VCL1) isoform X2 [Wolffia australiana]